MILYGHEKWTTLENDLEAPGVFKLSSAVWKTVSGGESPAGCTLLWIQNSEGDQSRKDAVCRAYYKKGGQSPCETVAHYWSRWTWSRMESGSHRELWHPIVNYAVILMLENVLPTDSCNAGGLESKCSGCGWPSCKLNLGVIYVRCGESSIFPMVFSVVNFCSPFAVSFRGLISRIRILSPNNRWIPPQ